VGVGAFSDRYNFTVQAKKDIPAGIELFIYYGDAYFKKKVDGEKKYGLDDFEEADANIAGFWKNVHKNEGTTVWDMDDETEAEETYDEVLASITNPRIKMIMSNTFEEAKRMRTFRINTTILSLPSVIRSNDWLKQNCMSIDNIYSGRSSMSQAGRGAFARRPFKEGHLILPMLVMAIDKKTLRKFWDDEV
jgi:hypothetical protein